MLRVQVVRLPDWVEWGARGEGIAALWVELGAGVGVLHTCRIHFEANDPSTSNFVCFWVLVVVILENQAKVIIDVWYLHTNGYYHSTSIASNLPPTVRSFGPGDSGMSGHHP